MGIREILEMASFIATTIGVPIAASGVFLLVLQTHLQRKQTRRDALFALYSHLDTNEARQAREFIYRATPEALRLDSLTETPEKLKIVDETLANLERMAYPIVQGYLPSDDAFNLYGQLLLAVSWKLWPYIEDQRRLREVSGMGHRLVYRRYLERAIRMWACRYAKETQVKSSSFETQSTFSILEQLFSPKRDAEPGGPPDAAR